jgi:hypothetical protein
MRGAEKLDGFGKRTAENPLDGEDEQNGQDDGSKRNPDEAHWPRDMRSAENGRIAPATFARVFHYSRHLLPATISKYEKFRVTFLSWKCQATVERRVIPDVI